MSSINISFENPFLEALQNCPDFRSLERTRTQKDREMIYAWHCVYVHNGITIETKTYSNPWLAVKEMLDANN